MLTLDVLTPEWLSIIITAGLSWLVFTLFCGMLASSFTPARYYIEEVLGGVIDTKRTLLIRIIGVVMGPVIPMLIVLLFILSIPLRIIKLYLELPDDETQKKQQELDGLLRESPEKKIRYKYMNLDPGLQREADKKIVNARKLPK